MMEAIVYTSNAGHTKEYATLLGESIHLPVYELDEAIKSLPNLSEVIYLGWLMAGEIKGFKKADKHFIMPIVCGVGMAKNGDQIEDVKNKNEMHPISKVFTLQGGFEMNKLHGMYKIMMSTMLKTVGKKLENKVNRTEDEEEMLDLIVHGKSMVSFDNLKEVIDYYGRYEIH